MELTVLGGSAAGVNTGAGGSSYLINTGAARILFDLGPGTLPELRKHADFRRLSGIVISHLHVDHILDLPALRFALAYNPISPPAKIPLWLPPGGTAFTLKLAAAFTEAGKEASFFPDVFAVLEYDPTTFVDVCDARVTFAPTVHYVPCWAMRLSMAGSNGDLVYTADTGPAANLTEVADGCAVLVAESTLLEPTSEPHEARGHLTAREAGTLAQDVGAQTLVLTHMWEELDFDVYRREAAVTFKGRIEMATPGLTVAW